LRCASCEVKERRVPGTTTTSSSSYGGCLSGASSSPPSDSTLAFNRQQQSSFLQLSLRAPADSPFRTSRSHPFAAIQRSPSLQALSGRQTPRSLSPGSRRQSSVDGRMSSSTSRSSFMLPRPVTSASPLQTTFPSLQRLSRDHKRSLLRPWLASSPAGGGGAFTHSSLTSYGGPATPGEHLSQVLRARSRITNLGVYILLGLLAFSVLANVRVWLEGGGVHWASDRYSGHGQPLPGSPSKHLPESHRLPQSVVNTLAPLSPELAEVDHLIVVAGCVRQVAG